VHSYCDVSVVELPLHRLFPAHSGPLVDEIRHDLFPQTVGGIDPHPELRPQIPGVCRGRFAISESFEHRSPAARTRIVDAQPLVDACLVEFIALAAIPLPLNDRVPGLEFIETDGTETGEGAGATGWSFWFVNNFAGRFDQVFVVSVVIVVVIGILFLVVEEVVDFHLLQGFLDAMIQCDFELPCCSIHEAVVLIHRPLESDPGLEQEDSYCALDQNHECQIGGRHSHQNRRTVVNPFR